MIRDTFRSPAQIVFFCQISLQYFGCRAELILELLREFFQSLFAPSYQNKIVLGCEFTRERGADSA